MRVLLTRDAKIAQVKKKHINIPPVIEKNNMEECKRHLPFLILTSSKNAILKNRLIFTVFLLKVNLTVYRSRHEE